MRGEGVSSKLYMHVLFVRQSCGLSTLVMEAARQARRSYLAGQVREPATARALRGMGIKANDKEQEQGFRKCEKGKLARLIAALALAVEGKGERGGKELKLRQGQGSWDVWRPCPCLCLILGWAHGHGLTRDTDKDFAFFARFCGFPVIVNFP